MVGTTTFLVLQDGTTFRGYGFGKQAPLPEDLEPGNLAVPAGEVVFNTGMCGYQEILTDPSYAGQIVAMTYPLIGNYGVDAAWNETGVERGVTRRGIKAESFVVRDVYRGALPQGRQDLSDFLESQGIAGLAGVDTRRLTLRLRDRGSANGAVVSVNETVAELPRRDLKRVMDYIKSFPSMVGRNLLAEVGTIKAESINKEGHPHVVLVDCGTKRGIIERLVALGARVSVLPSGTSAGEIRNLKADAALFSNGPGDPAPLKAQIACVKDLLGKMPVFGICLGHQVLGLALGATTYKMPFGHHGVNHPVVDTDTGRVFVTSQNHGFAVDEKTLPPGARPWLFNANDKTLEGFYHTEIPLVSVQFHPEACPGPEDSRWIFKEFLSRI